MSADLLSKLWGYCASSQLFWLTATLLAYQVGDGLFRLTRNNPLCNPVLVAVSLLVALLLVTGVDYKTYFAGAQVIHFLLGPATVALAVPLYRQINAIRQSLLAIIVALFVGSLTAIGSAVGLGWLLGGRGAILLSMAPKSVTTPIAMGISEQIGGIPSLTAVMVILTGIFGATFGGWLLDRLHISDPMSRGMALGVAAHGIGTARAMQMHAVSGAFAGLAMGLNGVLTAIMLPVLLKLFP